LRDAARTVGQVLGRAGVTGSARLGEAWATYSRLTDRDAQRAFLDTVRSVIDVGGQRVEALDRLYLVAGVPTLVVWGSRDTVIPSGHADAARQCLPDCAVEVIDGAGHFLHVEAPEAVAAVVRRFLRTAVSAPIPPQMWQERLKHGVPGGN